MTTIEWTDETWNPVTGCDRCSPGCDNCYALTLARRLKAMGSAHYQTDGDPRTSGPGFGVQCHPDALEVPLCWRKPRRVFVNSMSDLFHPDVPGLFIEQIFAVMAACPMHTFQILTKRPQRMAAKLARDDVAERVEHAAGAYTHGYDGTWPLPNVWLGTSIESDRYTFRADHLRATPAAVRFISAEPLLGPLPSLDLTDIDWLICGGESGTGARPMHVEWARELRDRCADAGTAFFFKQWGAWRYVWEADEIGAYHDEFPDRPWQCLDYDGTLRGVDGVPVAESCAVQLVGKKAAGRALDGRTWDEYPERVA